MRNRIWLTALLVILVMASVSTLVIPLVWAISFYAQIALVKVLLSGILVSTISILIGVLYRW